MDIDQHAEELASDLGVDKEEVHADLENLVSYSVPIDEAKQSLRRKYGDGGDGGEPSPTTVEVDDIDPDDDNVTVTVTVLTVGKRSIRYQGEDLVIYEGELADVTGTIDYTAWTDVDFQPGDTVRIANAGVREWEGSPELNVNESTTVGRASDELSVPYEVGGDRSLIDLESGDRGANVEVTVLELEERTIDGRDGPTDILDGVVADESGRLPLTDWDPHPELVEGASVRIENAYAREYRGVPSLNVTEFSTVRSLDRDIQASDEPPRMTVHEAVATGGIYDVEVVGNVIEVRDGSGLIERCPECGRTTQNGQCRTHGEVDDEDDLRVKAILDDGTGTVTAVLGRELTEAVYGASLEHALEQARDAMDREVVADTITERLVGREFHVRGHLSVDDYGANLDAEKFREANDPPDERAGALLSGVER